MRRRTRMHKLLRCARERLAFRDVHPHEIRLLGCQPRRQLNEEGAVSFPLDLADGEEMQLIADTRERGEEGGGGSLVAELVA